jgi:hypothetical protein
MGSRRGFLAGSRSGVGCLVTLVLALDLQVPQVHIGRT